MKKIIIKKENGRRLKKGTVNMRLNDEAIFKLTHPTKLGARRELARQVGLTEAGLYYNLRRNFWNGVLTTEVVLSYLEEELNMSRERMLKVEKEQEEMV
jgi:hypothetical protein